MRRFGLILFLLAYLVASVVPFAAAKEVIVATYNVRNYLSMDRMANGRYREDFPKPASETNVVRETIRSVGPDFIALQEIGSEAHLRELYTDLKNEGLAYKHAAILEGDGRERCVAALWNIDQKYVVHRHEDLTIRYFGERQTVRRGLLEIEFTDEQGQWSVFILHLKSKYTNRKDDYQSLKCRTLEARAIRDRILERYPDPAKSRFIVIGDFNDTKSTAPLRAFKKRGKLKITEELECYDSRGEVWTHDYRKEALYSKIDYILYSLGFKALSEKKGTIVDRKDYYWGSDHRLVWVEFAE